MNFRDTPPAAAFGPPARTWENEASLKNELLAFFRMLRRQTPLLGGGFLAGAVLVGIYALTATPIYRATAQIKLDPRALASIETTDERGRRSDAPQTDSARVDTMVEALKSTPILESTVRSLGLQDDPEFNGSRGSLIRSAINALAGDETPPSEEERVVAATEILGKSLTVERTAGTYVVVVGVMSESPEKSARLTDGILDAYVNNQLVQYSQTAKAAAGWMRSRLAELGAQTLKADSAVVDYKASKGILTSDGKLVADKILGDIATKLTEANADLVEKKARLDRIVAVNQSQDIDASVGDAAVNEIIVNLRKQYIEAQNRAAEYAKRFGEEHQAVLQLRRDAAGMLQGIRSELRRIEENYRSDYNVAFQREQSLRRELDQQFTRNIDVNQNRVQLQELESTAQAAHAAYEDMLKRFTEVQQKQSFPITEATITSKASVPTQKYKPRVLLLIPAGALFGLIVGFGIGVVRDMLDKRIRTKREAAAAAGVECLGLFPAISPRDFAREPTTFVHTGRADKMSLPWDYVMHEPFSVGAEAIRSIKVALDQRRDANRVIGIASSLPEEGKSTIASMLAHLLVGGGARVLLIDADMRNPALSRRLHPTAKAGLADVLMGSAAFSEVIARDKSGRFDFLPALTGGRISHSHDLLGSAAMKQLLDETAAFYDYVVIDLPPVLPVVDVRSIAPLIDALLFVVAWAKTPRDVVEAAVTVSPALRDKLIGVLLNRVRLDKVERYGEYVNSYYSAKYHNAA
ncbi:polysaccharide biosynthesis tyrosine autokinase [Methylobacterium sp. ID0610]|uniref:polysaccharide biosynthesis tyrosine autokinase n=1 Tax=Methylobacterium carpenticola TaxID=3344827 RepID=UPI003687E5AE